MESFGDSLTPCVIWQGAKNNKGYGKRMVGNEHWLAHRYAYVCAYGDPEPGKIIRHKCHNRLCVNPKHLVEGTYIQNMADRKARIAKEKIKCQNPLETR